MGRKIESEDLDTEEKSLQKKRKNSDIKPYTRKDIEKSDLAKLRIIFFFVLNKSDTIALDQLSMPLSRCNGSHQNPLPVGIGHYL